MEQTRELWIAAIIKANSIDEANQKAREFAEHISRPSPRNNITVVTLAAYPSREREEIDRGYRTPFGGEITQDVKPSAPQDIANWKREITVEAFRRGIELTQIL